MCCNHFTHTCCKSASLVVCETIKTKRFKGWRKYVGSHDWLLELLGTSLTRSPTGVAWRTGWNLITELISQDVSFFLENVCFVLFSVCCCPDEAMPPYSKPSFPSPGGHSSSGTTSSKGSTGPRKGEGSRSQHQRSNTEHGDSSYIGTNGQGQYSGELCKSLLFTIYCTQYLFWYQSTVSL